MLPFNQTDLETINSNIDTLLIGQSQVSDLIKEIRNVTIQTGATATSVQTQFYLNTDTITASSSFESLINSVIGNDKILISSQLICCPRPQALQPENDFIGIVIFMPKP